MFYLRSTWSQHSYAFVVNELFFPFHSHSYFHPIKCPSCFRSHFFLSFLLLLLLILLFCVYVKRSVSLFSPAHSFFVYRQFLFCLWHKQIERNWIAICCGIRTRAFAVNGNRDNRATVKTKQHVGDKLSGHSCSTDPCTFGDPINTSNDWSHVSWFHLRIIIFFS